MAKKPHKFAWNGVDIDTVLSARDLGAICRQAAIESTGDLWNGKHRIDKVEEGDGWTLFVVKNTILVWQQLMTFAVHITVGEDRTTFSSEIHDYTTTQDTLFIFIPVSPKKMVAHHTYMQFVHKVANTVRAADPAARIGIREGVAVAGSAPVPAAKPVPTVAPAAPATVPANASSLPELPPPPPPPPVATGPAVLPPPPSSPIAPTEGDLDDSTRKVPRRPRSSRAWQLEFPDGSTMPVTATVFVGRDPASDVPQAEFASVPDSERLVSKTHAMFDVREGELFVTDLHSANGTFLLAPSGDEIRCESDISMAVRAGWEVELGSYPIRATVVR